MSVEGSVQDRGVRLPWQVTWAVWRALFLREAVTRMSAGRAAWAWLLAEPLLHVAFLMAMFSTIRDRSMPGVDFALFLAIGVVSFHLCTKPPRRAVGAIDANKSLFSYRQVRPVDPVLVRCFLEGVLESVVIVCLLLGAALAGFKVFPHDPMAMVVGLILLWLFGLGLGLILSVGATLVPEIARLTPLLFTPLYFFSGILYRPERAPPAVQEYLYMNPILHGVEYIRASVFPDYNMSDRISIAFVGECALVVIFLGLLLQVRFARKLVAR